MTFIPIYMFGYVKIQNKNSTINYSVDHQEKKSNVALSFTMTVQMAYRY